MSDKTRVFTFGFDHTHPFTGESLSNCYVVVPGDSDEARQKMLTRFSFNWAHEYPNDEIAKRYDMREINWIDTVMKDPA